MRANAERLAPDFATLHPGYGADWPGDVVESVMDIGEG